MTWYFPDLSSVGSPDANVPEILKKSHGVVSLRVGFGSYADTKFKQWRDQAKGARAVLIYHFPVKSGRKYGMSVRDNALWFVSHVGKLRTNEVPVIDVESASGNWSKADVELWRDTVQAKLGGPRAMVYANQSYIHENNLTTVFTYSKGWVAKYGAANQTTSAPNVPWVAWQYAADGYGSPRLAWPGTDRDTDNNQVAVSVDEFVKRVFSGGGKPPVAPAPYKWSGKAPSGDPVLKMGSHD